MLDYDLLLRILRDQREEILKDFAAETIHRKEEQYIDLSSPQAQIVIGVRRCGKSTICRNVIRDSGRIFAYANFDDENLNGAGVEDLNRILECLYRVYGQFEILFLDEIQNVEGWHLFVNRMLRQKIHVLLTGSNSKLLSSEIATHLTGRNNQIEVFPFSFREYCTAKHIETEPLTTFNTAMLKNAFDRYILDGGFPELNYYNLDPYNYIDGLVRNILRIDIENRHRIVYKRAFEDFANNLMNTAPGELNFDRLAKRFSFKSVHTAKNYADYLKQAYLLLDVQKFSTKSRERVTNTKVYNIDCAMMNYREDAFAHTNRGWRLETVVLIELLRRKRESHTDVYYFKDRTECDFVLCRNSETLKCIQVCTDISDSKILRRELGGLEKASEATGCNNLLLLTYGDYAELETQTGNKVLVKPVFDWLLDN